MTLPTTDNKIIYVYSATKSFPVPFKFIKNEDIEVYRSTNSGLDDPVLKTEITDYTLSGANSDSGGTVTYLGDLTVNDRVIILRSVDLKNESDYEDYNRFPAITLETDVDRLVMMSQQLQEQLNRVVLQSLGNSSALTFPTLSASKYLTNDGSALSWSSVTDTQYDGSITSDVFANRPATPSQNGDIYISTDTAVIYVGVSGAWVAIGVEATATPYTVNLSSVTTSTNNLIFQFDYPVVITEIRATKSGGTSYTYRVYHDWNRDATNADSPTSAAVLVDNDGAGITTLNFTGGVQTSQHTIIVGSRSRQNQEHLMQR